MGALRLRSVTATLLNDRCSVAAGRAIVEAMGGKVTQVDGRPLKYNRENLLNPWFIVS